MAALCINPDQVRVDLYFLLALSGDAFVIDIASPWFFSSVFGRESAIF